MTKKNVVLSLLLSFSLLFSLISFFSIPPDTELNYKVIDLGVGTINNSPYVWGLDEDEFLSNNAGEALSWMKVEDSKSKKKQLALCGKDKANQKISIPELKEKEFEVYGFSDGIILGAFNCDGSCGVHAKEENSYFRQHLFIYYYKKRKFVDLRAEADKTGFRLYPLDVDWAYEVFVNDRGTVAGSFVVDGTVDCNWKTSVFYYHPDFGMKQFPVDGVSSEIYYDPLDLNNQGQFLFATEQFNPRKESCERKFYLYDPNRGISGLEDLDRLLKNKEDYDSYGLSEKGDILIKTTLETEDDIFEEIFVYNIFKETPVRISEEGLKTKIFRNGFYKNSFNEKGQTAFLKIKKSEAEKRISLIHWDPQSGEKTFIFPPSFRKTSFDRHGIDNTGRIYASYLEELFVWDEKNGIQWIKDLIGSDNRFDFENVQEAIVNRDGTVLVELGVSGEVNKGSHVVLLVPNK